MSEPILSTPAKRIGALVMVAGVAILVLGYMQYTWSPYAFSNAQFYFMKGPFWALRHAGEDSNSTGAFLLWLGFLMAIGGLFGSFLYDPTVGKIVHWIRTGSLPKSQQSDAPLPPPAPLAHRIAQPPSRVVETTADIFLLLLQNWLTALVGFAMGAIYLHERNPQLLLVPAGIALLLWVRSAFGAALTGDGEMPRGMFLFLVIKLVIAYVFVGLGILLSMAGAFR